MRVRKGRLELRLSIFIKLCSFVAVVFLSGCNIGSEVSVLVSNGGVVADEQSINCPSSCSRPAQMGEEITFTAQPAPGFRFSHWQGCDEELESVCKKTISHTGKTTIVARFDVVETVGQSDLSEELKSCIVDNGYGIDATLDKIKYLQCIDVVNIDGISKLQEADTLLFYFGEISDISELGELVDLATVSIFSHKLKDVSSLLYLKHPVEIGLNANPEIDCDDVGSLRDKFGDDVVFSDCSGNAGSLEPAPIYGVADVQGSCEILTPTPTGYKKIIIQNPAICAKIKP